MRWTFFKRIAKFVTLQGNQRRRAPNGLAKLIVVDGRRVSERVGSIATDDESSPKVFLETRRFFFSTMN